MEMSITLFPWWNTQFAHNSDVSLDPVSDRAGGDDLTNAKVPRRPHWRYSESLCRFIYIELVLFRQSFYPSSPQTFYIPAAQINHMFGLDPLPAYAGMQGRAGTAQFIGRLFVVHPGIGDGLDHRYGPVDLFLRQEPETFVVGDNVYQTVQGGGEGFGLRIGADGGALGNDTATGILDPAAEQAVVQVFGGLFPMAGSAKLEITLRLPVIFEEDKAVIAFHRHAAAPVGFGDIFSKTRVHRTVEYCITCRLCGQGGGKTATPFVGVFYQGVPILGIPCR